MRYGFAVAVLIGFLMGACLQAVHAAESKPIFGAPAKEKTDSRDARLQQADDLATMAGEKVKDFATQADEKLEELTKNRALAWMLVAGFSLVGALCMFFGWTLVKSLLIPFAPVLGLSTGGVMAFCIVESFYSGEARPVWFRLTVLTVGAGLGVAGYLFSALRAKPVAAFLVVMSPFLIISSVLFSYHLFAHDEILAMLLFCLGFLMGFAAMIEVRPVSILSTALLGACMLLIVLGLLSHIMGERMEFLRDFFTWLTKEPAMLAIALAVMVIMGSGFQFTTGPRGTLEG